MDNTVRGTADLTIPPILFVTNCICVGDLSKSDPFGERLDNADTAVIGNVSFDTLYLSAIDIDNQADVAHIIASSFFLKIEEMFNTAKRFGKEEKARPAKED